MEYGIGPRMRAARHLAGFRNVKALADELQRRGTGRGLGTTNLRAIEREEETASFPELREIAEACSLDVAWFTADLSRLSEISDDPRKTIAAEMAAAEARSAARRAGNNEGRPPLREAGQ